MAISVDYLTKIISIPQADLTPLGGSLYELDTDAFHLILRDWEDEEDNIYMPDTHSYNPAVLLGGIEYAPIVEIVNGYTITFEDGQYAVNLVGSNNNIADVTNVNQVSVRPSNSAGLIQTREIQYASFSGGVTVDVVNGVSGIIYPTGTPRQPVNNLTDAMFIATLNGFGTFYVLGDLSILGTDPAFDGHIFIGESKNKTTITIDSAADVTDCEYYDAHITGTLDGNAKIKNCLIENLTYIKGFIEQCVLAPGTITLGGADTAYFLDCWSGVPGVNTPTIDMAGTGQSLAIRGYAGGIKIQNKSGSESVSVDLSSGQVILDNTVTSGTVVCRGVGKLIDTSGNDIYSGTWNGVTIVNESINPVTGAHAVWNSNTADYSTADTYGWLAQKVLTLKQFIGLS